MSESRKVRQRELTLQVIEWVAGAGRSTQLRLFHGLVPPLVTLREAQSQIVHLQGTKRWLRRRHHSEATATLYTAGQSIAHAIGAIETLAAELGYPLDAAIDAFRAAGASLQTLDAMKAELATSGEPAWDTWAAGLNQDSDEV